MSLGVVLAIAAVFAFANLPESTAGDPSRVEESLSPTTSIAAASDSTTTTLSADPEPLWQDLVTPGTLPVANSSIPASLTIERLGVEAPIRPYGIDTRTGQMDVPGNVREVAWYKHGPAPGHPGSAVLAAHVDLQSQGPGVFFALNELQPGDQIQVGYSDGSAEVFAVAARATYMKEDLPTASIFSREGPAVLTLITCGGGFSASTSNYDSNVVVYAYPLGAQPEDAPTTVR